MENLPDKKSFLSYFRITADTDDAITKWLKSISFLSALIALLIFTDYFLPLKTEKHTIKNLIVRIGFTDFEYAMYKEKVYPSGEEEFWIILDDEEVAVTEAILKQLAAGDDITLYKTIIFGINVKGTSKAMDEEIIPYFNVYGFLLIIPILFLLFFTAMRIFGNQTQVVLSIGVINIFLLVGFGFLLLFY